MFNRLIWYKLMYILKVLTYSLISESESYTILITDDAMNFSVAMYCLQSPFLRMPHCFLPIIACGHMRERFFPKVNHLKVFILAM